MIDKFETELISDRLKLVIPNRNFAGMITDYKSDNYDFFINSSPTLKYEALNNEFQMELIDKELELMMDNLYLHLYIFLKNDFNFENIIGDLTLSNILRFPSASCVLGYRLAEQYTGNGYMKEALNELIDFIFGTMNLHRIEINVHPKNTSSLKLAKAIGFEEEGISKDYLYIDDDWEDYIRMSMLNK